LLYVTSPHVFVRRSKNLSTSGSNPGHKKAAENSPTVEQAKRPFVRPFEDNFPRSSDSLPSLNFSSTMYTPETEAPVPETKSAAKKSKKNPTKSSPKLPPQPTEAFQVSDNMNNNNILPKKVGI
jgi:hypothetical protein